MCRRCGYDVKRHQAHEIMAEHGLLQKKRRPKAAMYQAAKLLELMPTGPNQLWQSDVTYLHIPGHGWWYAITVIDYYSRYMLAIEFSSSYRAADCCRALETATKEAERLCGPINSPINLVTDNGTCFVAKNFFDFIQASNRFSHVRIQYRTPQQLGLLERFHRTLKAEEVYWRLYESPAEARQSLEQFRERYNWDRPHWALMPNDGGEARVPGEVLTGKATVKIPAWQKWAIDAKRRVEEELKLSVEEMGRAA